MIIDDTSNINDVILSLEHININNGDHKNVEQSGHTIELWNTQTSKRKVIDDMSTIKTCYATLEDTTINNIDHRSCAEQ